jgi:hypothetical protein
MAEGSVAATRAARRGPSLWATRAGHAAFAWAILFAGAGLDPDSGRRSSRWAMAPRRVPEHMAPDHEKRYYVPYLDVFGLAVEGFPPEQENSLRVTRHDRGRPRCRPRALLPGRWAPSARLSQRVGKTLNSTTLLHGDSPGRLIRSFAPQDLPAKQ